MCTIPTLDDAHELELRDLAAAMKGFAPEKSARLLKIANWLKRRRIGRAFLAPTPELVPFACRPSGRVDFLVCDDGEYTLKDCCQYAETHLASAMSVSVPSYRIRELERAMLWTRRVEEIERSRAAR